MNWAPDHCRVEVLSPGIIGCYDGVLLLEAREVFTSGIDAPKTEETSHLST